jgi:hypothetical protein
MLDERKHELERDNPGWQIWYVPHTGRTVTWCARLWPLLNADSPEQLQKLIDQAPGPPRGIWRPLLAEYNYATRVVCWS